MNDTSLVLVIAAMVLGLCAFVGKLRLFHPLTACMLRCLAAALSCVPAAITVIRTPDENCPVLLLALVLYVLCDAVQDRSLRWAMTLRGGAHIALSCYLLNLSAFALPQLMGLMILLTVVIVLLRRWRHSFARKDQLSLFAGYGFILCISAALGLGLLDAHQVSGLLGTAGCLTLLMGNIMACRMMASITPRCFPDITALTRIYGMLLLSASCLLS